MKITVKPSPLTGLVQAPASKSAMQRACAAALIKTGKTIIKNSGHSNDDKAALNIIQSLGAVVTTLPDGSLEIYSSYTANPRQVSAAAGAIHCGESGLSIRMFTPLAALAHQEIAITGDGSLAARPMDFFDKVLPQLNVNVSSHNGRLPLKIQGPLQPKNIIIDGSLSSQFLTGLLMAYSVAVTEQASITVTNLKSKPYIDLTLDVMQRFGLNVPVNQGYGRFTFLPKNNDNADVSYTVEGDWSGGAFLLVAGAIAGNNVLINGLSLASTQADRKIMEALSAAGAAFANEAKGIRLHSAAMQSFDFDATDCPDLFPPLVALAAYCHGTTTIHGVSRLAHKESDRGITLQEEFAKIGVRIDLQGDTMRVQGGGNVNGAAVHSRHDHRIAMACSVAALKAAGEVVIEEAQAINKSYPGFFDDLKTLGAQVKEGLLDMRQLMKDFKNL